MAANQPPLGNPAVVGLAGFGLTTLILQFHNLGLCGLGPVIACGLIFGGLAQLIAGTAGVQGRQQLRLQRLRFLRRLLDRPLDHPAVQQI